jgi:H+/Cl- antiporter ClcA
MLLVLTMSLLPVLFFIALVAFQVWVSWRVWRTDLYLKSEKSAQFKLIWLVPLLGAVIVYSVLSEEDHRQGPPNTHLRG